MKNRGIDALVNDCLIGPVLTMVSYSFNIFILFRVLCPTDIIDADESLMFSYCLERKFLTSKSLGINIRRVPLRFPSLPLSRIHQAWLQPGRGFHPRRTGLLIPHRTTSLPDLHDTNRQRGRHPLCRRCVGPGCSDARSPRLLRSHGARVSESAGDDSCVSVSSYSKIPSFQRYC